MKAILNILVTALLAWLGSILVGWWMIVVAAFLVAVFTKQKAGKAFLFGAIGVGLLWLMLILKTDAANNHIFSNRMAGVIGVSHTLLLIINVVLGMLMGGLGGWSGAAMRKIFES